MRVNSPTNRRRSAGACESRSRAGPGSPGRITRTVTLRGFTFKFYHMQFVESGAVNSRVLHPTGESSGRIADLGDGASLSALATSVRPAPALPPLAA